MVVWDRVVMVEIGKDEAQRLSSIQFIISVSSSPILALDNLSCFPSFSSFSVFMVVRYHFELDILLKTSILPNYDPILNMLKTLQMLGKF